MTTLSLPAQFEVERLKRYLQEYPEQANSLASEYFQDYLELVSKYQKLENNFHKFSVTPASKYTNLQADNIEWRQYCFQLQAECVNLREDNQVLKKLIAIIAPDLSLGRNK